MLQRLQKAAASLRRPLLLTSLLPLAVLLTSCASSGVATKPTPSNGCEWVRPIYISKADVLTQGTADQILNHDEAWQKICGTK